MTLISEDFHIKTNAILRRKPQREDLIFEIKITEDFPKFI